MMYTLWNDCQNKLTNISITQFPSLFWWREHLRSISVWNNKKKMMKEVKEDKQMERHTMFMDLETL